MSVEQTSEERFKKKAFIVGKELLRSNEIPTILVYGDTLPEAWETAVLATLEYGSSIPTEYDQPIDPESKDASVMIVVTDPFKEPRIHKNLPGGLDDLAVYVREVVEGIHDDWVREGGWSYSYHDRLVNWPGRGTIEFPSNVDQIEALVQKLAVAPYSRRAQAITWVPPIDQKHDEPPCLQRVWCRVVRTEQNSHLLEMNTHWRSRDGLKAAFMNMFALTELQRKIAQDISRISGRDIQVGRYVDVSDSFHIYGSYLRKGEADWFLKATQKSSFEKRVFRTDDPKVKREFARGCERT